MFCGLSTPAYAANKTKATTLRLEKTTGTVTVTNASGKSVKTSDGSKLYSGYSVATGDSSYAWISLDDNTVIKTDTNTTVTVKQSGKKLEVMLESGDLFFNVSKPVANDSSLNIRTSNMSTGIRGTSGHVFVRQQTSEVPILLPSGGGGNTVPVMHTVVTTQSQLVLFDGRVTLTYSAAAETQTPSAPGTPPPAAAAMVTAVVTAGHKASVETVTTTPGASTPEQPTPPTAPSTKVTADVQKISVPKSIAATGFVAVEVAIDKALQDRIVESVIAAQEEEKEANQTPSTGTPAPEEKPQSKAELKSQLAAITAQSAQNQLSEDQAAKQKQSQEQQAAVESAKASVEQAQSEQAASTKPIDHVFDQPAESSGGGSSGSSDTAPVPTGPFTVTFYYGDPATPGVFATQSVALNQQVTEPVLVPSPAGVWKVYANGSAGAAYDFTAAVTADLALIWEDQQLI